MAQARQTSSSLWHHRSVEAVCAEYATDPRHGLSSQEVAKRIEIYGHNALPEQKPPSRIIIFLRQFKSPMVFILAIAGVVTILLGEHTDGLVIWAAVLVNTVIGFVQEDKATHALDALQHALEVRARVIRDGHEKEIDQQEVVPGDIVMLRSGDKVPADARIIKSWGLRINEAILTGEWIASEKTTKAISEETPLADRENMAYMGSVVEQGEGRAVVIGTGMHTEVGRVATLVQSVEDEKTPYQQKLAKFSGIIITTICLIAVFIFVDGLLTGGEFVEMFTVAVAVAVAAIPEGLPVAMTAILAIGMQRILKKKGLVRNLTSAETLGSSSVIATDKTLTLTEGRMEVQEVVTATEDQRIRALKIAALANEAFVENPDAVFEKWIMRGNPTDQALLRAALEAGLSRSELEETYPMVQRIPFDAVHKYIASVHQDGKQLWACIAGAPETLIGRSKLTAEQKQTWEEILDTLTSQGLRVVGVAERRLPESTDMNVLDDALINLELIGLIAMKDPLRKGVKQAITQARRAGIKTIMVTGDHMGTARAIAKELGMLSGVPGETLDGVTLDTLSDEALQERLDTIAVYARVEPKHKMRIIHAWQDRGEVIAMTGDGINDAPALRKADIGIALGSGTDVAKEASNLVLLGDKFSIIPAAIREGRIVVDNIRKVITYLLSGTFSEVILIAASLLMGLPLPVTAVQILWINLVEDGLPGIAFIFEKGERDVMDRKPEPKKSPLLTGEMKAIIFIIGVVTDVILLGLFMWLLGGDMPLEHVRTFVFVALGIDSLLFAFSCKNLHRNIWHYSIWSNTYLLLGVGVGLLMIVAVVYVPFLQHVFETVPLNGLDWILLVGFGLLNLILIEAMKWIFITKDKHHQVAHMSTSGVH